jgi:hypothetical protein
VRSAASVEACARGVVEQRAGEFSGQGTHPTERNPPHPQPLSRVGEREAERYLVSGNRTDSSLILQSSMTTHIHIWRPASLETQMQQGW